jgi:anti-sigma regulatory factor (Ser/Thr protein kinase)
MPNKEQFYSSRSHIRRVLQQLCGDNAGLLEVAVNEAINNAVHSAEKSDAFFVQVKLNYLGRRLVVRVKDSGAGFCGNKAVAEIDPVNCDLFSDVFLNESGRGIMIMKTLLDRVVYNRQGNEILLVKRIGSRG